MKKSLGSAWRNRMGRSLPLAPLHTEPHQGSIQEKEIMCGKVAVRDSELKRPHLPDSNGLMDLCRVNRKVHPGTECPHWTASKTKRRLQMQLERKRKSSSIKLTSWQQPWKP